MTDKHTCCGKIWGTFGFHRCGRGAKYAHEGNWYCKPHHPPTAQQKFDAMRKAREEAAAAKAEMERRAALYPELLAALVSFTKSGYIKKQHPKRYAAAVAAIAKAEAQP
jgi:hypothetical protein